MMEIFWFEKMQLDGVPKLSRQFTRKSVDRPSHAASWSEFVHHMRVEKGVFDLLSIDSSEIFIGGINLVHNLWVAPAVPGHSEFVTH